MTRKRKDPTLKDKLAATLRELGRIPYDHARLMTADQVISLFQFDHGIYHVHEGSDEHWNLTPLFIMPHREKTKVDIKQIRKTDRISRAHEDFRNQLLKPEPRKERRSKWASRPFPTRGKQNGVSKRTIR